MSALRNLACSCAFIVVCGFIGTGCSGSKEDKWLGTYKSGKDNGTLVIQGDHKGTLDMVGSKADITWEAASDDKIIVHAGIPIEMFKTSDGLRDQEGTNWKKT